jgi:hypothetical protein
MYSPPPLPKTNNYTKIPPLPYQVKIPAKSGISRKITFYKRFFVRRPLYKTVFRGR